MNETPCIIMALKKVSIGLNQSKEILYPNVIYIALFMLILDQKKNTRSVLRGTKKLLIIQTILLKSIFLKLIIRDL